MPNEINKLPPPCLLALIVCDQIIRERTGKASLIGIFSGIHALNFPAIHHQMALYVQLTNGHGKVDLAVKIVDVAEEDKELFGIKMSVSFQNALQTVDADIMIQGFSIPHAGEYRFQVYCGDELLGERRFIATKLEKKGK